MMTSRQFIDFDGYLKSVSDCSDADFPFMDVALHLAEIDRPGLSVDRYRHELDRYAARARVLYDQMAGQDPRGQVYDQYNTLLQLIVNEEQYKGDDVALFGKDNRQKNPHAITAGLNYTPIPLLTPSLFNIKFYF